MKWLIGFIVFIWLLCGLIGSWLLDGIDDLHVKDILRGPITLVEAYNETSVPLPGP
jgi:hypothetical protein